MGSFGGSDRYYAEPLPAAGRRRTSSAPSTAENFLLPLLDWDLREQVSRVVKQWGGVVREQLRSATGLKLSTGDERQSVPIRIEDGLPKPFAAMVDAIPSKALWWVLLHRPRLREVAEGLGNLDANLADVVAILPATDERLAGRDDVGAVRGLVRTILAEADKRNILEQIKQIETDVLGAYFYNRPEIQIYWMVIAAVSRMLAVPVADLTLVVLTHELAHAYTHLGRDIDGTSWDTAAFAAAELPIVEGLAQFYTRQVCKQLRSRIPGVQTAFETLLQHQSEPYTVFEGWTDDHERAGEIVRFAMIDCRSHGIEIYRDFEQKLGAIAVTLPRSRRR